MNSVYPELKELHLPSIEKEILTKWEAENTFQQSVQLREGAPAFVFYEGPPSANGMPGIHHVISRTLKDLVCRYKTMQGFQVQRKGGWDTHGLPVELGVEKELGITKEDIGKTISVEEYNARCKEAVLRYKNQWDELTKKMGYWVDLNHPYITFHNNYIETLWWLLKQLYEKEFLYESVSIQPYSPAAGTGLSSHELNQPGTYKMVKDISCVAMFKVVENEKSRFLFQAAAQKPAEIFFLAWTTTPWTLPSNLALAVGASLKYVLVETINPYSRQQVYVILAKELLPHYFQPQAQVENEMPQQTEKNAPLPWKIITSFSGKQLEGISYEQLLPFEANKTNNANAFKVLLGNFVTTEEGTGIVHIAPAFGADDFKVGKQYNIGILVLVDKEGKFIEGVGPWSGRYVKNYKDEPHYKDVNAEICDWLKQRNRAFAIEKYEHNYPHCWRTDKPVLYYPLDAWFIKTTAVKERMIALNKTIQWKPQSTGEGRFGNWLENMVDWNLSRSRFWGTPLPVWRTEDEQETVCIGSVAELTEAYQKAQEAGFNKTLQWEIKDNRLQIDLHKPYVDEIVLLSASGKPMKRVPDLVDVWFDSGAMPYAQWHYPFENKEIFQQQFPADFIAEGVDQTRGWFYTLHALAVMLFDSVAYKTVVSNGLVLDKKGNKMSKRLGNAIDPFTTIATYGADATRWYLITNASPWENLKFDLDGIQEVQRKFFGTLYNTYQFFVLYANVDGFVGAEPSIEIQKRTELDRWILSALHSLTETVTEAMNSYEPTVAGRAIETFVEEHLSNWYVRLSRRRFWKGEYGHDKLCAYQTLYECLITVLRLMAPIAPFFSEAIFLNLNAATKQFTEASIHHTSFPVSNKNIINVRLEKRMQLAQDASSLILSLRKKANIKVRQPLQRVYITALDATMEEDLLAVQDLIKTEVNVKDITLIPATHELIKRKAKPNFKVLGKKAGKQMKPAAAAIALLNETDIYTILEQQPYELTLEDGSKLALEKEDIEVFVEEIPGYEIASKGAITVALDITLTEDLKKEGDARELINRIQNLRKEQNLALTDRIEVSIEENEKMKPSIIQFKNYICAEILADSLTFVPQLQQPVTIEVNGNQLKININKKG